MKLTDFVVSFLEKKGIHDFFGYQGTMIAHLVDSIERNPGTKSHSCYNEQGASFAACGYAQAKGACGCAYATSGPGAVNLLSGVANAYFDSLPVIFLTGQLNTYEYSGIDGLRQQGFQEIDIVEMAKPVTKYAVQIREPQDVVRELNKAWYLANSGRKGPVLLDLPMNVQRGEVERPVYEMDEEELMALVGISRKEREARRQGARSFGLAGAEALKRAKRPVILMGQGAAHVREELLAFARERSIPVITSVLAKDALPAGDDLNYGCIGGAYGHRCANMIANAKSDLLLCFGISLCTRQIGTRVAEFAKGARILRVDVDPCSLQRDIHEGGVKEEKYWGDAGEALGFLKEAAAGGRSFEEWLSVCRQIREELWQVDERTPERRPNRMLRFLGESLSDCGAVAVDVGQHMVWAYQSYQNKEGQKMLFSGGHGAMGYALPAAIGAYYALKKPTACICGDGALQMNIQELQWVRREGIPVRILVFNNQALGMIRHLQKDYFDNVYADTTKGRGFSSCGFARVALGYQIPAAAFGEEELEAARAFLEKEGPLLAEISMEPGTFAYPKTCLGEPIHNQQPYMPEEVYERLMKL